jgi:hypothetical protein
VTRAAVDETGAAAVAVALGTIDVPGRPQPSPRVRGIVISAGSRPRRRILPQSLQQVAGAAGHLAVWILTGDPAVRFYERRVGSHQRSAVGFYERRVGSHRRPAAGFYERCGWRPVGDLSSGTVLRRQIPGRTVS